MKQVVVRRYQLRKPIDWTAECEDQLRKQNQFWNRLVEIDHQAHAQYRALLSKNSEVAAAEAALKLLTDERSSLITERKQRRKAARANIDANDINTRLADLKPEIAKASAALKVAKTAAKEDLQEARKALSDEHFEAAKKARQDANADGLWWGNANAVFKSYQTARGRAMREGTVLKFHSYRGEGRITNQIQNGGMTVDDLFEGRHPQVQVITERNGTTLSATIYARGRAERKNVTWPMWMSNPIPDDAKIKQVVVTRKKIASHYRHAVVFTTTRDEVEPLPPPNGPCIAIDLGWRRLTEGLRVGTVLAEGDNQPTYVICPEKTLTDIERCESLRKRRDELRNAVLLWLTNLDWNDSPAALRDLGMSLRLSPASPARRVATLAMLWRDYGWRPKERTRCEEWRRADKRMWEEEANLRDKAVYRRTDTYRKAAKEIAERAGVIILRNFDIAEVARKETKAGDETSQARTMRRYRTLAAPGDLRRWVIIQAEKRGVPIRYDEGTSNNLHHLCGIAYDASAASRRYCSRCDAYYDVDENACRNMLQRYVTSDRETKLVGSAETRQAASLANNPKPNAFGDVPSAPEEPPEPRASK
jgi:transposase